MPHMNPLDAIQAALDTLIANFYDPVNGPVRTGSPQAIADYDQMVAAICSMRCALAAAKDASSRHP